MTTNGDSMYGTTSKKWKIGLLGAAAALALTTTACEPGGGDAGGEGAEPSTTASASASASGTANPGEKPGGSGGGPSAEQPSGDQTGPGADQGANTGGGDGNSGGNGGNGGAGGDYADRQTPPGPVCANNGKGPYMRLVAHMKDDDAVGNDLLGVHIGGYDCADASHPVLKLEGGGNHTTNMSVDEKHLKVVVAGRLAQELGAKEVDAQKFLAKLDQMEQDGELGFNEGDPLEFYYQMSGDSPDDPYGGGKAVYLHQVNTLE
ncbi:hypothetical protein ACFQVC_22755 [Streptomyces monticola]|uniref:Uncharacterized protein n=1 Tax=Streptomyces monticola TaxID=2666263 RepID=A0ABW2JLM5_9ACTN